MLEIGPLAFAFVGAIAFAVSGMTLFAGFGLGTLLLPAFALLFPIEVAVAATAVVHGLNNFFKLALLARHAAMQVVVRFGVPAVIAAFLGAALMTRLAIQEPVTTWRLLGREAVVTPIGLAMGALITVFAVLDLSPVAARLRFQPQWLPVGGAFSGFFGGLSGHQGALRAAFLLPLGLTPTAFAASQATIGSMVDIARLMVYGAAFYSGRIGGVTTREQGWLVAWATLCAFAGAYLGRRLLQKVTVRGIRVLAAVMLLLVGFGLATGLI